MEKRKPLTECIATFSQPSGGTSVRYVHHHTGCALDLGRGECNCDPIRISDWHSPREPGNG